MLEDVYRYIDEHLDEHLTRIQEWVRQPSISNTGEGIQECAELTKKYLEELGCSKTQVVDVGVAKWGSRGNPVVYGEYDAGAEKTLIIYMMYDVMPTPDLHLWRAPPFKARILEQPPFKRVLLGRGAVNTKGPQGALLNALHSIKEVEGDLPLNLKFVVEGDEERMSIGLHKFVHENVGLFEGADALFWCGTQSSNGTAWPVFGSEGCLYFELETSGERWGRGPRVGGIHGFFKRLVDSPAWRHIKMLSTLVSEDGNKVMVEGWYDDLEEPSEEDLKLMEEAMKYADLESLKRLLHLDHFIDDLPLRELCIKAFYDTTLNLDGIWGGLTEPGNAGALLPSKITSKHDCRYSPNQEGEDLLRKLRAHLDRKGYQDVVIRVIGDVPWLKVNFRTDIAKALLKMYEKFDVRYVLTPATGHLTMGPYWPGYLFGRDPLHLPVAGGGLGHGGRYHAANEYYVIDGYGKIYGLAGAEKGYATVLYNYAGI